MNGNCLANQRQLLCHGFHGLNCCWIERPDTAKGFGGGTATAVPARFREIRGKKLHLDPRYELRDQPRERLGGFGASLDDLGVIQRRV
jgi:hypothetical protein